MYSSEGLQEEVQLQWYDSRRSRVRPGDPASGRSEAERLAVPDRGGYREEGRHQDPRPLSVCGGEGGEAPPLARAASSCSHGRLVRRWERE